jgi:hypothetical protein
MKKCPFCAEEIQEEALKCRFCNEFLDGKAARDLQVKNTQWYLKTSTLVVGFFLVGPLILPLVWLNPHYSKTKKSVITGICLVITFILYRAVRASVTSIEQYYQML